MANTFLNKQLINIKYNTATNFLPSHSISRSNCLLSLATLFMYLQHGPTSWNPVYAPIIFATPTHLLTIHLLLFMYLQHRPPYWHPIYAPIVLPRQCTDVNAHRRNLWNES